MGSRDLRVTTRVLGFAVRNRSSPAASNMVLLCSSKTPRLYSLIFCSPFASRNKRLVIENVKPSLSSLQNQLLYRPITSKIPENQHNFTVDYLIRSCGLSPKAAISASKRLELQNPERADSVLAFLRDHGFSEIQISKLVRSYPRVLLAYPERTLLPKLEFFSSLGVSKEELAKTLASTPHLLSLSLANRIVPTYEFLRSLISEKNVVSVIKFRSRIFLEGHCKNVAPNIGLLRELGVSRSCISLMLAQCTQTLMLKPENFVKVVDEVRAKGLDLGKATFMFALRSLSGKNSKLIWDRSREVYRSWGWSEDDILFAFRKNPQCMNLSEKKITLAMDFFVNKMGWPSGLLIKCPAALCLSLENRIIPRCSVVKVLLLKGLINENFSLSYVLLPVEKQFLERFVTRYLDQVPQLLSLYQGKVEIEDV
ncbi:hypothetical protein C1H46_001375 [Malus baccata]|uniref:Uncharacterized protein n=1 Tax=Malus baccata TaxID=106549 RepID=A0A540NR13_MALBA|nr:hypothetical protein C1H46_001375 [Malus baccata]